MNQDQLTHRKGRRALFAGTDVSVSHDDCIPISEVTDALQQISEFKPDNEPLVLSSTLFEPVLNRIIESAQRLLECKKLCAELQDRLSHKEEMVIGLEAENTQLASERESYLQDLIVSHTEFDRALEIFQYHETAMVLTGQGHTIHDANDAFCNLFSIARSEITQINPSLAKYIPDELLVFGPDGVKYVVISITPPIVPFDKEAISLLALIKSDKLAHYSLSDNEEDIQQISGSEPICVPAIANTAEGSGWERNGGKDICVKAFEEFPIPAAIVNQHQTIIFCNQAFCNFIKKDKNIVFLRDIGSVGISFNNGDCLLEVFQSGESCQCAAVIRHPDGEEISAYFEIGILEDDAKESCALIVGVPAEDEDEDEPEENESDILMLRILLDLNPSAAALIDFHARVVSANEGFAEITGLCPTDLNGTDVRDLGINIPDSVLSFGATDVHFISDPIRLESAWGVNESNGIVAPFGYHQGKVSAVLILQPIEHVEANQAERVKSLNGPHPGVLALTSPDSSAPDAVNINLIPIPGIISDFSGKIVEVNNGLLEMFGTTATEVIGKKRNELFVPQTSSNETLFNLVTAVAPLGELTCREISGPTLPDESMQIFWYVNLSFETDTIRNMQEKIAVLESELKEVRKLQGSIQQKRNFNGDNFSDQIDIVEFELNDERYAIDITMVREVVEMLPITPLPKTPAYVIGIINLRGEVTHIVDLAILLGQRPRKDRSQQKIIIIPSDVTNGEHVGIIVDNVQSVTEIEGRHVSLLGDDITTQIQTHIKGIIKITNDDVLDKHTEVSSKATLVIWLDIKKILNET